MDKKFTHSVMSQATGQTAAGSGLQICLSAGRILTTFHNCGWHYFRFFVLGKKGISPQWLNQSCRYCTHGVRKLILLQEHFFHFIGNLCVASMGEEIKENSIQQHPRQYLTFNIPLLISFLSPAKSKQVMTIEKYT